MGLNEIIAAITASAEAMPDFTDETAYPSESLSGLLAEAITAGTAMGADQLDAKRAHVRFAKAVRAEIDRRASAAVLAAEAAVESTDLDAALAAATPAPVTASDEPTEPAAPEIAAPVVAEATHTEPAPEPVSAATDPAPTSPSPTTEASMTTSITPDINAQVAELTATVAAMQAERQAEQDAARRATLTLDAPNLATPTDPAAPRRATLTILRDGQEPVQTNDVLTFGDRVRQVAEESLAGYGVNKVIASVPVFEPGTPMLQAQNPGGNTELLFSGTVSRREARTAAACDCGPLARRLELPVYWTTDTPLADAITNRWPIETMSYEFFRSTPLSEISDGVEVWTCDQQAAIDPADVSTWKPCATLDCETEKVTANAWAVWSCLLIDEFQNWSILPIAENRIAALAAQTARTTEAQLQARLRTLSRHFSAATPLLGANVALFEVFDAVTAATEWADRLSDVTWTPVVPMGLEKVMRTDDRNKAFGEPDMRAFARKFTDAGYAAPVVIKDDYLGAVTSQWISIGGTIGGPTIPLPTFKAQTPAFRIYLVDMNSIHMGQRNVYTMREVRDLDRYRQNQYGLVAETAMSLDRHGPNAPIALYVSLCASGTRSELTTYDCDAEDYGLGS